jgi:hypothetical protein
VEVDASDVIDRPAARAMSSLSVSSRVVIDAGVDADETSIADMSRARARVCAREHATFARRDAADGLRAGSS